MAILTRRNLLKTLGVLGVGAVATGSGFGVWNYRGDRLYRESLDRIFGRADFATTDRTHILREIVRFATMAPNSHNTQPWRFALDESSITISPDESRRCPVVDPDDHHLFVTLGCAAENAVHAASAFGWEAAYNFDDAAKTIRLDFTFSSSLGRDRSNPLFDAIRKRQSTRGPFDGQSLTTVELERLHAAGTSEHVDVTLVTAKEKMESVLDLVVEGNRSQMLDPEFVAELRHWLRSSYFQAVKHGDGLFSKTSGYPAAPEWIGKSMFDMSFTLPSETEKYTNQCRTSAGFAIFTAHAQTASAWAEVGRSFEKFALEATAMGVLHSHVNQPIEVVELRPKVGELIGKSDILPDLVVRFGRGKALPKSLRRPLDDVIVLGSS